MGSARITAIALLVLAAMAGAMVPASPCLAGRGRCVARLMHVAAGFVCHQRADRSLIACGRQWPVCGRCSGLYLGAAAGAMLAAFGVGRGRSTRWWRRAVGGGGLLLAASWLVETAGLVDPGTPMRLALAVPLGLLTACWLGEVAREPKVN